MLSVLRAVISRNLLEDIDLSFPTEAHPESDFNGLLRGLHAMSRWPYSLTAQLIPDPTTRGEVEHDSTQGILSGSH
jgi:hypothetical protein